MDWLTQNWQALVALVGAVVMVARIIVKLTPTPRDDAWLAKVVDALKHVGLHLGDEGGGGPPTAALLVLGLLVPLAAGCQAPLAVRQADAFADQTLAAYVRNTQRIHDVALAAYKTARDKDVEYTTAKVIEKAKAAAGPDGKLPAADLEAVVKMVIEERDKANAQTAAVQSKIRDLVAVNNSELKKALRVRGAITEWLDAGIDESAIPGMIQEVAGIVGDFRGVKVPALPSGAPAATTAAAPVLAKPTAAPAPTPAPK
jgi:hypothetical protein